MKASAFLLVFLALLGSCSRHSNLPVLGTVTDFALLDQSARAFRGSSLRGHTWVADFIYTNCPGPCPLMSQRMKRIQNQTPAEVRLVSFTVDPARDTPSVLADYARHFGADLARWTFLTGDPATLQTLDRDVFKLGDLNPALEHSTRFVLVDARGRIRGYYSMGDENMLPDLVRDARALSREPA